MDFSKNLKAYLRSLPLKDLNGHQIFLAIAAYNCKGDSSKEVDVSEMSHIWSKGLTGKSYSPNFYNRAQEAGWVDPVRSGTFLVNKDGIQHLEDISITETGEIAFGSEQLYIFEKKSTHSFDKFLRNIFAKAQSRVFIADSWVDETIFDNVLDSIPNKLEVKLIYGQKRGAFDSRVVRFKKEWAKFVDKKYSDLHDRFVIVDSFGYIIGPSIKDAASHSPALLISLNKKNSAILMSFFQGLWSKAR